MVLFLFITVIVLLNMLIAMMNQRYNDLLEKATITSRWLFARRVHRLELTWKHMIGIDRTRCGKVDSIDPLDEASVRGREGKDLYCYKFEDSNSELLASNLALPRTKEADEIAERVLARFGSAEKPAVVAAAAAAAPTASADAIAELVVAKLAQRQQAPPTKVATIRRHRRSRAVAAAPRGAAAAADLPVCAAADRRLGAADADARRGGARADVRRAAVPSAARMRDSCS